MSSVMIYFLLWTMTIYKQECAVIRLDNHNRNTFEYVIQKYMNPLRRLSADLPNHAIEMEIEIHGSVPRDVTVYPQRRVIRLVNPRHAKPMMRSMDIAEAEEVSPAADTTASTTTTTAPDAALQTTTTPAAPSTASVPVARQDAETESPKIPVFMEDLKKALDDLEKKLITNSDNAATVTATGNAPSTPQAPIRSIDDIVQMLKKGIHVEHRMPKAGDEKLEWVQIKIPKSMQL